MINYPGLRLCDNYPAVGVLQHLLVGSGTGTGIDGSFGTGTKKALSDFQALRGLSQTGTTDPFTWHQLTDGRSLPIIDVIDVFDASLWRHEVHNIRALGGLPLLIGGSCNGLEQALRMIVDSAKETIFFLRFHGHGQPGEAGISEGKGELKWDTGVEEHSALDGFSMDQHRALWTPLKGIFGPYGCIQFMHCSTGAGKDGWRLLQLIAEWLGVPATAALQTQYAGDPETFFFEGPTRTAVPGGRSVATWAMGRPPMRAIVSSAVE